MSASRRERSSTLQALSDDLATAVEHAAASVVAVNARPRIASSGVHWRPGVVVTASHTVRRDDDVTGTLRDGRTRRSEEHTSELQSQSKLVCRLLLEKKKN